MLTKENVYCRPDGDDKLKRILICLNYRCWLIGMFVAVMRTSGGSMQTLQCDRKPYLTPPPPTISTSLPSPPASTNLYYEHHLKYAIWRFSAEHVFSFNLIFTSAKETQSISIWNCINCKTQDWFQEEQNDIDYSELWEIVILSFV